MIQEHVGVIQLSTQPNDFIVLEKRIGEGGFGCVYKGKWKGIDLAIKRSANPNGKKAIRLEVSVLKLLQGLIIF